MLPFNINSYFFFNQRSFSVYYFFFLFHLCTVNPLYFDIQYNNKIRYNDNLTGMKLSLERWQLIRNYASQSELMQDHFFKLALTNIQNIWPRGYKTFFMLNSAKHEIYFAYKS